MPQHDTDVDELIPDPQVWKEFGVTDMTLSRWTADENLGFPPAIKIRNRNFRSRRAIEEFKRSMIAKAIASRKALTAA
jgi:hypothetical protein